MSSTRQRRSPSSRSLARVDRQQAIADFVLTKGVATPNELTGVTGASLMTVHRDLDELARRGVLRKFHGGVSAQPSSVFESSSAYRMNVQVDEKEALARAALARIEPGMSVMLDTSTTNLFLAHQIAALDQMPLTVITNYLPILQTLRTCRDVHLIAIGGDYNATHDAFLGLGAVAMVESLSVNLAVLSTSAMTPEVTYHQENDIVTIKRAMMAAADRRVLLMDPTKIRRTALHRLAPVSAFDELVLTQTDDTDFVKATREHLLTEVIDIYRP
ncbi:MAG TPA: DeoR/GlpR family DNA-binding transcription regulator [Beutenbergiaceae bacterium]|nr:DeoR/GlpR family DNA-binding transcription regulator [Beutenbergiaceae bacterium]